MEAIGNLKKDLTRVIPIPDDVLTHSSSLWDMTEPTRVQGIPLTEILRCIQAGIVASAVKFRLQGSGRYADSFP